LLKKYGGVVVGKNGREFYPAGTEIPPTEVDIIRPADIPTSFTAIAEPEFVPIIEP
jgi:hypothetical protein